MTMHRRTLLALAVATGLTAPSWRWPQDDTIKIGLLATFEGPFTVLGEDGDARRHDGGRRDRTAPSPARRSRSSTARPTPRPTCAVRARASWSSRTACKILVGPLSGDEGIAVNDYARTQPDVTFINGSSAAQDTTLRDPAPNFFRFSTDGAQWMAGLGTYAFKTRATSRSPPSPRTIPSPTRRCSASWPSSATPAAHVPSKSWVPLGTKDFSSVIAAIPEDVDAIYVALGGADARQLPDPVPAGRRHAPLIGGSITVDQTVLDLEGQAARRDDRHALGRARSPTSTTTPAWKAFVKPTRSRRAASRRPRSSPTATTCRHAGGALGLDEVERRPLRRRQEAARGAVEAVLRDADGHGLARQEPPGHRRHLPDRGHRGRRTAISSTRSSRSCRR